MATTRGLTNVIVAHEAALLEKIETSCPYRVCKVELIDFSDADLQSPWNSNQIAKTRHQGNYANNYWMLIFVDLNNEEIDRII